MEKSRIDIEQRHCGSGSNKLSFSNNVIIEEIKQISQHVIELAPNQIRVPLSNAIELILQNELNNAETIISTLDSTGALDAQSNTALLALKVLSSNESSLSLRDKIIENIRHCKNSMVLDLALAALLWLDIIQGENLNATTRYLAIETKGELTNYYYLKNIASAEDISDYYNSNILYHTNKIITAIAYGYLRVDQPDNAISVLETLGNNHTVQVKKLLYFCQSAKLNHYFSLRHYWTLNIEEKKLLDETIEKTKTYIKNQEEDPNVARIASACLHNTNFEDQALVELCYENEIIFNYLPQETKEQIKFIITEDPDCFSDKNISNFIKSQNNDSLKESLISFILEKKKLSSFEFLNIRKIASPAEVRRLISNNVTVDSHDDFTIIFCKFQLEIIATPDKSGDSSNLALMFEEIINNHKEKIKKISSNLLLSVSEGLIKSKLIKQALDLIENSLPTAPWSSPIYEYYIDTLFKAKQFKKLNAALDSIPISDWSINCWALRVSLLQEIGDLDKARETLEQLRDCNKDNISVWECLLDIYDRTDSVMKISEAKLDIPVKMFDRPSDRGWRILHIFMKHGHFKFIEPIILKWFLNDPDTVSTPLTNFVLSGIFSDFSHDFSNEVDKILSCYILKDTREREIIKLVVRGYSGKHSSILDASTPNAVALMNSKVGDQVQLGISDYVVIEILPPFMGAAWRIAPKLRALQNDGTDSFQIIDFIDDGNVSESMAKVIARLTPQKEPNKLQAHPDIPIQIKGFWLGSRTPVESAIQVILDNSYIKNYLPNTDVESNRIALDIYAMTFIALSGLQKADSFLKNDYFITDITKSLIDSWIIQAKKEHMRAGIDESGRLVLSNEQHTINQRLINGFEQLIQKSKVVSSSLHDIDIEIIKFEDLLDISTFSTMCAASIFDYSYFSIDNNFTIIFKESNVKFESAHNFYVSLFSELQPNDKIESLSFTNITGLGVPLRYQTILNMAEMNKPEAIQTITMFIRNSTTDSIEDKGFFYLLPHLALIGLKFTYLSTNRTNQFVGTRLVTTAFRCVLNSKSPNLTTEDLVVKFFTELLKIMPENKRFLSFSLKEMQLLMLCNFLDSPYIIEEIGKTEFVN